VPSGPWAKPGGWESSKLFPERTHLYSPHLVEGKFFEVRQFGTLGALRLSLARESSVNHMINEVIVKPLSLPLDTLPPET
jgi:hypothetical protein